MSATIDPIYPVELEPVDISPYRAGNAGVDYVTTFDSGRRGPHVMMSAVVHGNELCGAIALDFLFRNEVRPRQGKLTLNFANYAAYHAFDPEDPMASRFIDEDFNRTWGKDVLEGNRDTIEVQRARELRPVMDTVDYLLDIHSMQHKTPPLMISGPLAKGRALARELGTPAHIVSDAGHDAGIRMRDYADFGVPDSPKNALLIECGQHWEAASGKVAIDTALRFLKLYGMVDDDFCAAQQLPLPDTQTLIEVTGPVTVQTDDCRFVDTFVGFDRLEKAGTLIGWDGDREIRTPYDNCILIMPSMQLRKGESAVRFGRKIPEGSSPE